MTRLSRWISSMKRTSCGLERGEHGRQVALALEHGPAGDVEADPELGRHDAGQRGLAEPRRARPGARGRGPPALAGGLEEDRELLLDAPPGPMKSSSGGGAASGRARPRRRCRRPGWPRRSLGSRAGRRRLSRARPWRTRPSASRPAGASARAASASSGRKPSADQAVARGQVGVGPRRRAGRAGAAAVERAEAVAQLQHHALGRALAHPARGLEPAAVAAGQGQPQLVGRVEAADRERQPRADAAAPR